MFPTLPTEFKAEVKKDADAENPEKDEVDDAGSLFARCHEDIRRLFQAYDRHMALVSYGCRRGMCVRGDVEEFGDFEEFDYQFSGLSYVFADHPELMEIFCEILKERTDRIRTDLKNADSVSFRLYSELVKKIRDRTKRDCRLHFLEMETSEDDDSGKNG